MSKEIDDEIALHYKPQVRRLAMKLREKFSNTNVLLEDLIQEGYLGIWEAFNQGKGDEETRMYAWVCMRNKMVKYCLKMLSIMRLPDRDKALRERMLQEKKGIIVKHIFRLDDYNDDLPEERNKKERINFLCSKDKQKDDMILFDIHVLLSFIPACHKKVLLTKLKGYTNRETAQRLGLTQLSTKGYAHKGLEKIIKVLKECPNEKINNIDRNRIQYFDAADRQAYRGSLPQWEEWKKTHSKRMKKYCKEGGRIKMPWTSKDAKRHKKGLSSSQAKKWANIANGRLKACLAEGDSQKSCEGSAIRVANAMSVRGGRRKT